MIMSRMHAPWQLYLFYGVIFGIGLSSVDVISMTTIARWFTAKRGLMTGIVNVNIDSHMGRIEAALGETD